MAVRVLLILGLLPWVAIPRAQSAPKHRAIQRTSAEVTEPRNAEAIDSSADEAPILAQEVPKSPVPRTDAGAEGPAMRAAGPVRRSRDTDPVSADWGNMEVPRPTPSAPPPVDYLLVRPPQGVAQQDFGNGFEQTVANPDETYHHGPYFCTPVDLDRPDGLAPIGVIGDHTLEAGGQFLISYRYNNTMFNGLRDGTDNLSTSSVLGSFPIAPTSMQTQRQTLLAEFGVTDDLTLLALLPFWDLSINQVTSGGQGIVNSNTDPGDVLLQALYVVWRGERQQIHLNLGLQLPLGLQESERFAPTPNSPDKSYPLRTSSGTYDFMPGATYRGQNDDWTWGVQGIGTIRSGISNFNYKLGNRLEITGWLARKLSDNLSLSARLDGNIWADYFGADPRLNQLLVPTNRPDLQGGRRIDLLFGMNFYLPGEYLRGQWFSVEGGIPIYQFLQGPQLKSSWTITAGYNLTF